MQTGASKYAGGLRKRNEQYVFLVLVYLLHVLFKFKYKHASKCGKPSEYCYAFRIFSFLFSRNALYIIYFS